MPVLFPVPDKWKVLYITQPVFTYSNLTIKTADQYVKSAQS